MSESELRQRTFGQGDEDPYPADKSEEAETNEQDGSPPGIDLNSSCAIPQGTDSTPDVLQSSLSGLTPRWRNWVIRGIFTFIMIFSFGGVVYLGPIALVCLILVIQIKCYHEIITIGYIVYKSHDLPWFRTLSWYFLLTSNYFFYGESVFGEIGWLQDSPLVTYHRFIAFSMYCAGVVGFVLSLVKKHYLQQFTLFGWTHVTLLLIVTQSHLTMGNIFNGIIWFLVPVSMIICNDIMAYMFGFFFGKTPLIKLSPKKTWEGFIGGAFSTVVFGIALSYLLCQFDFFICPLVFSEAEDGSTAQCERSPVFLLTDYQIPKYLFLVPFRVIRIYPFMLHSISLSLFASIIGPFGGFFASGFKRAFKIKDFGDTIPGHGGFMDRFDCQLLMASFVNAYYSSFIRAAGPGRLLAMVYHLKPDQQLRFYTMLKEGLIKRGLLSANGVLS